MSRFLLILFFILLAAPAIAVDGVLEINQTCAVQTGCFPGDSPGFPVEIAASGSYRLTSNLDIASVSSSAIRVTIEDVTIDLGGFTVQGPVTCSGRGQQSPAAAARVPGTASTSST